MRRVIPALLRSRTDPDAERVIGAILPTGARAEVVDRLVYDLKVAGVWSKMQGLYALAGHNAAAARTNWITPGTGNLTEVNSPTFTTDRGYTGNGSTSYLLGATLGSPYTQNSANVGVWVLTNSQSGADAGTTTSNRFRLYSRNGADASVFRVNGTSLTVSSVTDSTGYRVGVRRSATAVEGYLNGASIGTDSIASEAVSAPFTILRDDTSYSAHQIALAHVGAALSTTETLAAYTAFNTYLSAVGAV